MRQLVTRGIILTRTDFGEADRILTLLTPEYGKLRLMARGVRRVKSKLAGGIELFSVSSITFAKGRGDLGTLVSARLEKHYGNIVKDLQRTMTGYELTKRLNKATEDAAEPAYFEVLHRTIAALDDLSIPLVFVQAWFAAQLLQLNGHTPDMHKDVSGKPLQPGTHYTFDLEAMAFMAAPDAGQYGVNHIKMMRLILQSSTPKVLTQVQGSEPLVRSILVLLDAATKRVAT